MPQVRTEKAAPDVSASFLNGFSYEESLTPFHSLRLRAEAGAEAGDDLLLRLLYKHGDVQGTLIAYRAAGRMELPILTQQPKEEESK
jgi:hypothetical protein